VQLIGIDWAFILGFFVIALGIGVAVSRSSGRSESDFFLGGRSMPWWLLGFSMVATTFSTDTPNFVTDVVRQQGVAGNWNWWAFLLTGMLTVFVYARLWRRSGVTTDVEFYAIRYSGKAAGFLRVFRACYLGIAYNVLIMAMVSVAAIKIGAVMLGTTPWQTLGLAMVVTVIFSAMGGFKGVLFTDFLLFIMAMVGAFAAAYYALGHESVGGIAGMVEKFQTTEALSGKLNIFPDPGNVELFYGVFAICLAVQWWAAYYPGAEPGGGGYLVQRMLAAKDEKHALGATLFFNFAHYALRPWPWIIVALCSLLVFPELQDIKEAFPAIPDAKLRHDVAYSAMIMKTVPNGWLGLIMASLIAAYMSTISTHLNWGSCYIVHDLLPRVKPDATTKEKIWTGRISTVVLMLITAFVAMYLRSAKEAFDLVILVGAGTGLLFILRWFWWRINAWCEIVAMVVSFSLAIILKIEAVNALIVQVAGETMVGPARIIVGVSGTTVAWLITAFVTKPTDTTTLRDFCRLINPSGPGWKKIFAEAEAEGQAIAPSHEQDNLPMGILCTVLGSLAVYGVLFAAGEWIYGNTGHAVAFTVMAIVCSGLLLKLWKRVN
jgi:Na+/proline symporter